MTHVRFYLAAATLLGIMITGALAFGKDARLKSPERVRLTVGRSQLMDLPFEVKRVSLGNPDVADVLVLTPRQVYILGKGVGATNLLIEGKTADQLILDLLVDADLSLLKEKLHKLLPDEPVEVYAAQDGILLKGVVSSSPVLSSVLSIAEPFAPGKVVNLMQVGGRQQVLLEVRISEVSRSAMNNLRVNLHSVFEDSFFAFTNLGGALPLTEANFALPHLNIDEIKFDIANSTNMIIGSPNINTIGFLEALKENGLVKILAEPNLMTVSGQEATFLAGGEFPIPVAQQGGEISVEFRKFGIQLQFTPTVLDSGKISLRVAPQVSELDFSTAIQSGGVAVPGLSTRSVSTTVELNDGHTLAIAGLIRDNAKNLISKFPILGDIPVLGALFRSTSFQKNETELLVLVTPRLVKSLGSPETVALPTDRYAEYERELVGLPAKEKGEKSSSMPPRGGLEGAFGHGQ